ncbi:MAG: NAD(P)/FAD-dependent oxidoreductase [Chitinophagales bacterium]|nr:NAD(P)/FAD-dependent oxidoreductase [Chitinophagales bacterium]
MNAYFYSLYMVWDIIIIGGGAAGFFAAINCKEKHPEKSVLIIEKDKDVLKKVKISGGGRCNVTHACFEPKELVKFYPRGGKELLSPFHRFCTGDIMAWLDERGVPTKIEEDNRVFPASNESQSIIDCFMQQVKHLGIKINNGLRLDKIEKAGHWILHCGTEKYECENLIICSGSQPKVWEMIQRDLGHTIIAPIPSLFTFNIKDPRIENLMGISVEHATVKIPNIKMEQQGALLITHWGLSGPAVLKLSAVAARELHALKYQFRVQVNWLGFETFNTCLELLQAFKQNNGKNALHKKQAYIIPKRLWENLSNHATKNIAKNWGDVTKQELNTLAQNLTECTFGVTGKSTFKDEFVTAGGVDLKEMDFKTFSSKLHPNLYFAGEVLNIDALTGGFNFQAAWTGAWVVSESVN